MLASPAQAFSVLNDMPMLSLKDMRAVKPKQGSVPWETFGKTREREKVTKHDGLTDVDIYPIFPPEVKALDGKTIRVTGFMFPLDQEEQQAHFLIGPFPMSCPFHYHAINALIIEVLAKKPMKFTLEPITIEGTLKLTGEAGDGNFYQLQGATIYN